jgi:hypothetical protein
MTPGTSLPTGMNAGIIPITVQRDWTRPDSFLSEALPKSGLRLFPTVLKAGDGKGLADVGLSAASEGDISDPGLVLVII